MEFLPGVLDFKKKNSHNDHYNALVQIEETTPNQQTNVKQVCKARIIGQRYQF